MSHYYHTLLPDSIRLLRLLPHEDKYAPLKCQLFSYSLQESGIRAHPYDALSYVWGGSDKPRSISIGEHNLPITEKLHEALSRLRYRSIERIMWVDAVCINQENEQEKEQQIQFMAKIYGQANRVVVWLGEAADNSGQALEEIRIAGGKATNSSSNEAIQPAVLKLFERPWFRRIWVLQEVAAARSVLIVCGPMEIDGYAFCLGVDSLKGFYEARADLQSLIRSVTYLIRGAIFRPNYMISSSGRASQSICPLGELVDMYHTHEATKRHDKVYALLGMSSDDLSKAHLLPNYGDPWEELLQRLAKFLLPERVSVKAWGNKEIAVIKSKGCILGKVSSVERDIFLDGRQGVNVIFNIPGQGERMGEWTTRLTLQPSAKSIREGDLICLLEGASKLTIIRLYKDYCAIIMITATPLEYIRTKSEYIKWPKLLQTVQSFTCDFLLVWNWESSLEQDPGEYEALTRVNNPTSEYLKRRSEGRLDKATRTWNVALILEDLKEYKKAQEMLLEAIVGYEIAFGKEHLYTLKSQYGLTPLLWAAGNGYDDIVSILLAEDNIDPDLKDGQYKRTALSWAAEGGHEAVVKLLLKTGKVNVESKDKNSRTVLSWAAEGGHTAVVKLLLDTGKANIDIEDRYDRTALSWAAKRRHRAVVKLLLETGKAKVNSEDKYIKVLFWRAAEHGHDAIFKLLLEAGKFMIDLEDQFRRTVLSLAAEGGHKAVVKLLLETGKAKVDSKDRDGRTPLSIAAGRGHEVIVKLLLETGKAKIDSKDWYGRTALSWATYGGHEAVVKLLLKTGKFMVDLEDKYFQRALLRAAEHGDEAKVKLLLETSKAEIDSKDWYGRTALSWAAGQGHVAVVKLLLETGKAKVNPKDKNGWTALFWAAEQGHSGVVKLLLKTGKAKVNSRDKDSRIALSKAAESGHEAVVKLLLRTSKAKINSRDRDGRTPLSIAAGRGHEAIVKLLLETGKAEIDSKDRGGRTPLSRAAEREYGAVLKLLQSSTT